MKRCPAFPGKKRYGTQQAAKDMARLRGLDGQELRTYACRACGGWHLALVRED